MRIKQRIAAYAAAGIATAGLGTGAMLATATPAQAFDSCDLSSKVNELESWDAEDHYNIIVWKDSAFGSADLHGVKDQGSFSASECATVPETVNYHWVIFEDGTFDRVGDGGYRNWAFSGVFDRPNDTHVDFHKRF
jgi:hypothetical protein